MNKTVTDKPETRLDRWADPFNGNQPYSRHSIAHNQIRLTLEILLATAEKAAQVKPCIVHQDWITPIPQGTS